MNKENKRKSLFFTLSISILLLVLSIICFVPTNMVAKADVDTSNIYSRAITLTQEYVDAVVPEGSYYYNPSVSNASNTWDISDDIYGFSYGANIACGPAYLYDGVILPPSTMGLRTLSFDFNLLNPDYMFNTLGSSVFIAEHFTYYFDLYKCSSDGLTSEKVLGVKLYVASYSDKKGTSIVQENGYVFIWGLKQYSLSSELMGIAGTYNVFNDTDFILEDIHQSDSILYHSCYAMLDLEGYTSIGAVRRSADSTKDSDFKKLMNLPYTGDVNKHISLLVSPSDYYSRYFLTCSYTLEGYNNDDGYGIPDITGTISSKAVSVSDVLLDMYSSDNTLSSLYEVYHNEALGIINNGELRDVRVSYLEQVMDTSFAIKKYATVSVPVNSNRIAPSIVAEALGLNSLAVGTSPCIYFEEDDEGVFNAIYLESVWLSAKDENGMSNNYYLSINKSFREYYYGLVQDGVFTKEVYNYYLSLLLNDCPTLGQYTDSEIYGYFGYVVIPNIYSLNSLWTALFGDKTTFDGVVNQYMYEEKLSLTAYNRLLKKYGYSWLSRTWNEVASLFDRGGATANHYLLYVSLNASNGYIGENGADDINDNSGSALNGVEDAVDTIKGLFDIDGFQYVLGFIMLMLLIVVFAPMLPGLLTVIGKFFLAVLKGIWYIISAPFKLIAKAFKGRKR